MRQFNDTQIRIIKNTVGYKGRKVHQKPFRPGMSLNSYWSGGSRDYFFFLSSSTLSVESVIPQNGTMFDKLNLKADELPPNTILVQKSIIGGREVSITIYS